MGINIDYAISLRLRAEENLLKKFNINDNIFGSVSV